MNESCDTYMYELCETYECAMSHICINHFTHRAKSQATHTAGVTVEFRKIEMKRDIYTQNET